MFLLMVLLFSVSWYTCGMWGFIFWYTTEFNLGPDGLLIGMLVSILGPFTWLVGSLIHGKSDYVIVRRRK